MRLAKFGVCAGRCKPNAVQGLRSGAVGSAGLPSCRHRAQPATQGILGAAPQLTAALTVSSLTQDLAPLDIGHRLLALTQLLRDHAELWRPLPFVELQAPWQLRHPELTSWLDGLSDGQLADPNQRWLEQSPPWLADLAQRILALSALPWLARPPLGALGAVAMRRIRGRKVEQMAGFCAAVLPQMAAEPGETVDWCSGKGHLGRTLVRQTGAPLLALELDPELVRVGQQQCDHLGLRARFACADVLDPATAQWLHPGQWVVALHACGDLHAALLRAAIERQVRGVALAPCCYNRIAAAEGRALSLLGRAAHLDLTATDLDLIHREPVVANGTDWQRAQQEQAWRLGFDLLQRQVTGSPTYRTMPNFPRPWLRLGFGDFCRSFAALDDLQLPPSLDLAPWEQLGWQRLAQVRRLELVRGLFRPAVEAWLVLDRAQLLVEAGFQVQVGQFCARTASPRNALIVAERPGGRDRQS